MENPITIEDAFNGEEGDQWKKAIDEELGTLKKMRTWELADLPEGRKPIGCKWVFVKKRDEKGKLIKYKTWLIAQGFSQKPSAMVEPLHWLCSLKPCILFWHLQHQ